MGVQNFGRRLRGSSAMTGIRIAPRMDSGSTPADLIALIEQVNRTFNAFKEENNKAIADLKKGMGDVVQNEKVDRINGEVTKLQQAIDDLNVKLAGNQIGGSKAGETEDLKTYRKAFNRFFRKGDEPANLRELEVKAMASIGSDPDGGYTVLPEIETAIDRVLADITVMRQISRVMSISANSYKKLTGQGGTSSGWVGETDARPNTNTSKLAELEFPTMELYAQPAATQGLLDDSYVDIGQWLADEVQIEFTNQEGNAFINGDGVKKPRGLLSYQMVADANYAWGKLGYLVTGAAADFVADASGPLDALLDLQNALKTGYQNGASWLMNRYVATRVRKVKDTVGDYIWQPSIAAGQPATLLGKAVAQDDYMPKMGANNFIIAYGDFQRAYLIVDRAGVRVLRDPFTQKPYVLFYTTKRVGGGVANFEAVKFLKCST